MKLVFFKLKPHPQTFKSCIIAIPEDKVQYIVSNIDSDGKPEGPVLVNAMPIEESWQEVLVALGHKPTFEAK